MSNFKHLFEDPSFSVEVRSQNSISGFTSTVVSPTENARIDEQLTNARIDVNTFFVEGTLRHRVGRLPSIESRTPTFTQFMFTIVIWKHK